MAYDNDLKFINTDERKPFLKITIFRISILLLIVKGIYTINDFEVFTTNDFVTTKIYDNHYVNPANVHIEFPEVKRNLIYLYVESFENTFASKKNGGAYTESLIPNLESLIDDPNNVHFSHNTQLGGYGDYPLMKWSAAGIFSTQSGVPLKPFYFPNYNSFPNIITLTDILNTNGYSTHLSSTTPFYSWGTLLVFNTHNTEIHDPETIFKEKPKYWNERRNNGCLFDYSLYEYAKEKINEITSENRTFFMAFEVSETHFPSGLTCRLCEHKYPKLRRFNKVRRCTDQQVYNFVKWIQSQPFGNDTTIFITGDHLCMGNDLYRSREVSTKYNRTVFNLIINPAIKPNKQVTQNRKFAPVDWFPTILAAIGAKIHGDKLGMGTNLFSGIPTLVEREPNFAKEITKYSKFYSKRIAGDVGQPMLRIVPQWMPPEDLNDHYRRNNYTRNYING